MVVKAGSFIVKRISLLAVVATAVILASGIALPAQDRPSGEAPQAAAGSAVKNVGVVKSIHEKNLVLKTDSGPEISISVPDSCAHCSPCRRTD